MEQTKEYLEQQRKKKEEEEERLRRQREEEHRSESWLNPYSAQNGFGLWG